MNMSRNENIAEYIIIGLLLVLNVLFLYYWVVLSANLHIGVCDPY